MGGRLEPSKELDEQAQRVIGAAIKAHRHLAPAHKAQVISYLKATGLHLGLLINLNVPVLRAGIRRIVLS